MYIPNYEKLNGTSADIINAIFASNPAAFPNAPTVDINNVETFSAAWSYLDTYEPRQNEFLSALTNRIFYRVITSRLYMNPLARWKKGIMEYGDTIEEIFIGLVRPENFETNVSVEEVENSEFGNNPASVYTAYHSINYRKRYGVDASYQELQTAFLNANGITDFIIRIIESLYTSAAYDEQLAMTYLLYRNALAGNIFSTNIPTITLDNMKDTAVTIKALSDTLVFMNSDYNMAGVDTYTPKTSQILITTPEFNAKYGIEILAYAFNPEYAKFSGSQMQITNFTSGDIRRLNQLFEGVQDYVPFTTAELATIKSIGAFLVDERFFQIYDNLLKMTYNYLGSRLKWKHWLHKWMTLRVSPFANAIMFTTENPVATAITLDANGTGKPDFPAYSNIEIAQRNVITANVTTTGGGSTAVTWDIDVQPASSEGNVSFVANGNTALLTIDAGTPISTITITATTVASPNLSTASTADMITSEDEENL